MENYGTETCDVSDRFASFHVVGQHTAQSSNVEDAVSSANQLTSAVCLVNLCSGHRINGKQVIGSIAETDMGDGVISPVEG